LLIAMCRIVFQCARHSPVRRRLDDSAIIFGYAIAISHAISYT